MPLQKGGGKLPGKTKYSGRRRTTTRKSGFHAHPDSTGGEFRNLSVATKHLSKGGSISITFSLSTSTAQTFLGFGGWFCATDKVQTQISGCSNFIVTSYSYPCWNKFGSMWLQPDAGKAEVCVIFTAQASLDIAFYGVSCGQIKHKHLRNSRPALLTNMYLFSPEALIISDEGRISWSKQTSEDHKAVDLALKSCNRCARYLPQGSQFKFAMKKVTMPLCFLNSMTERKSYDYC